MHINEFVGLAVTAMGYGGGITTTVVSLMANVNKSDRAVATRGAILLVFTLVLEVPERCETVSYFFRSLGSVIGLSLGSTLLQSTLRSTLRHTVQGKDADEVRLKMNLILNASSILLSNRSQCGSKNPLHTSFSWTQRPEKACLPLTELPFIVLRSFPWP